MECKNNNIAKDMIQNCDKMYTQLLKFMCLKSLIDSIRKINSRFKEAKTVLSLAFSFSNSRIQ